MNYSTIRYRLATVAIAMAMATGMNGQAVETDSTRNDTSAIGQVFRQLPEIVVSGTQPIAKLENGKIAYNMRLLQQKMPAANAFEALRNIPGVVIDGDDGVSFASQSITLILNGKPTSLTQEQVKTILKSMPAERLQQAELMLSAPPAYHVRGTAINLVTTSLNGNHSTAGQVEGSLSASRYMKGKAAANIIHTSGRWIIDASYQFRAGKSYGELECEALHPLNDQRVAYNEQTEERQSGTHNDVRLGVDYTIGKGHSMGVAYTGEFNDITSRNTSTGSIISRRTSDGNTTMHNIDWNYQLPFGLMLSASYTRYGNPSDQILAAEPADASLAANNVKQEITSHSHQTIDTWMVSADQSHRIGQRWGLSYGVSGHFAHNSSSQTSFDANGKELQEATSSVDVNERIVDVYAGFNYSCGQTFTLSANIEAENYHSPLFNEWRIFPSFSATWKPSASNVLMASLSSDAAYPSYWTTMSGISYSSAYIESWGNPDLRPSANYKANLVWQFRQRYTLVAFA